MILDIYQEEWYYIFYGYWGNSIISVYFIFGSIPKLFLEGFFCQQVLKFNAEIKYVVLGIPGPLVGNCSLQHHTWWCSGVSRTAPCILLWAIICWASYRLGFTLSHNLLILQNTFIGFFQITLYSSEFSKT